MFFKASWSRLWVSAKADRALSTCGGKRRSDVNQLQRVALLITFGCLALLVASNVWRAYDRANEFDSLMKQAIKEIAEYRRNPSGTDPAEKWWKRFWELRSNDQSSPEVRNRATLSALFILMRSGRDSRAAQIVEGLGPKSPGIARLLPVVCAFCSVQQESDRG
jgi:hypothetical protein